MHVASQWTPSLSLVYALIDSEHVVSVFPVGNDGEANTDVEYYLRGFGSSAVAIQVYLMLERAMFRVEREALDPLECISAAAATARSQFYPDS